MAQVTITFPDGTQREFERGVSGLEIAASISSGLARMAPSLKKRLKDYGRAYFNRSIYRRLRGDQPGYRPNCGALKDFFFIDPYGNVSPCNGSADEWIIGNIKNDSFENIMSSAKAKNIINTIDSCNRECSFIVTERHDMVRRPWIPISWVIKNKMRISKGKDICVD